MQVENRDFTDFGDLDVQIALGYMDKRSQKLTGGREDLFDLEDLRRLKFYTREIWGLEALRRLPVVGHLLERATKPFRNPETPDQTLQQLNNFRYYRNLIEIVRPHLKSA
jgi:hypothetical protein